MTENQKKAVKLYEELTALHVGLCSVCKNNLFCNKTITLTNGEYDAEMIVGFCSGFIKEDL